MLPQHHFGASLLVAISYISILALICDKVVSWSIAIVSIGSATIAGVLIDIDHLMWALILNPKLTIKYMLSLNFKGL